ncbi:MAG: hypothetical protein DMG21_15695 [Acidobacteria bacterium]|nr:MAG: hypothetical protein DMG21_15695 [Acidobacteriota bacterium]
MGVAARHSSPLQQTDSIRIAWLDAREYIKREDCMKARVLLLSAFAALLVAAANYADEHTKPASKGESVLRVETRLVQVNVVAQDSKGNAITGLTRDDFTLFDNGKKIPIDEFSAVSIATQPNAPTLAPRTFTNRVGLPSATVILLDGLNTAVEDQTWARAEVISFLEKLEPQDRVAIFLLGDHLMVLQNFTSDPKVLLAVLKNTKPRAPQELGASAPPAPTPGSAKQVDLETALAQLGGATGAGSGATGPNTTGMGAAAASNAQAQEEAVMIQFEQHQASFFVMDREGRTVAALVAIANFLAQFPGRKNLVWVSSSFPVGVGFDTQRQAGDTRDQVQFTSDIKRLGKALNNADLAIYPVDPRGLVAGGAGATGVTTMQTHNSAGADLPDANHYYSTRGIMEELADDTGGKAYYNTNDLAGVIRRAVDDYQADYTLGFYPHIQWDGRYHDLKVKVNRPGVHLRYRKGYFASLVPAADTDQGTVLLAQAVASPLDSTGLGLTVAIVQQVEKPARRVKLHITTDAHGLTFQEKNGEKAATGADSQQHPQDR